MKRIHFDPGYQQIILAVSSGVLLALAYPEFNLDFLGWVGFVPLLFALEHCSSYRRSYFLGLLTGMTGIAIGFHWVANWAETAMGISTPLNGLFLIGFAFSFGQLFGFLTLTFAWLKNHSLVHEIIVFPVVLVTVFTLFPLLFQFRPGDSQWQFFSAIQPIDITGIAGLDFMMALVNIVVYKFFQQPLNSTDWLITTVALVVIAGWFVTGVVKLNSWDEELKGWSIKKIGIVQPNREPALSRPVPAQGYSRVYPLEMELSKKLVSEGAQLLVWPEGHFFGYTFWDEVQKAFQQQVNQMNTPLVFYDATRRSIGQKEHAYNTILFLNEKGELIDHYDKIKLVPFSEYMPVFGNSFLFDWILGDYLDNLTPGAESKTIVLSQMRIVPKTCYEPLFPEFVAESIGGEAAGKLILVQSQDGWFGKTSQPFQHLAVTVMRAVENRVPLIHVIQNGPSAVIQPSGRLSFKSKPFTRGSWVAEMPYHPQKGGSFYSRHPNLFINIVKAVFLMLLLLSLLKRKPAQLNT